MRLVVLTAILLCSHFSYSQNLLTYAGSAGREHFNDVVQISDGTVLVAGGADDMNWIPASVPKTTIPATGITSTATGYGFILRLSKNLQQILQVVSFPANTVRDVYKIRVTTQLGKATGAVFISGNRDGTSDANDGYFIAKLNNNFINDAIPTACTWVYNALCPRAGTAEADYKKWQPWDVGSDGKVVLASGREIDYDWAQVLRLNTSGQREVVKNWRAHWSATGEWDGTPASAYTGAQPLQYSAIVMKVGRSGSQRSATSADYSLLMPDGNGGTARKGKLPDDYYFSGPCDFTGTPCAGGPGYTGYTAASTPTQRCVDITIDRRDNSFYFGYCTKSVLPGGQPDFEPAVVAYDSSGMMKWWSRLYTENSSNSSPDQYVDGVGIDYANNRLVVLARCHGNNTVNFWNGNAIAAASSANGFQNQFTGSSGNIHISWLGKFSLANGILQASTYVAEFAEAASGLGTPSTDPALDGWPSPNSGWPTVNTTKCNNLKVTADGSVCVACVGRRTMTTANAYQKMPKPGTGSVSSWNAFVRMYAPDLSKPLYSSLLVGQFDTLTGIGGDNTVLAGLFKTDSALIVTGYQKSDTNNVPQGASLKIAAVPAWGASTPSGQSAVLARYTAAAIVNAADNPITALGIAGVNNDVHLKVYPVPTEGILHMEIPESASNYFSLEVFNMTGRIVMTQATISGQSQRDIDLAPLPAGAYMIILRGEARDYRAIVIRSR